jgi:hypothetical protein
MSSSSKLPLERKGEGAPCSLRQQLSLIREEEAADLDPIVIAAKADSVEHAKVSVRVSALTQRGSRLGLQMHFPSDLLPPLP